MPKHSKTLKYKNWNEVLEYAESIRDGKKVACKELKQAVDRFFRDLENPEYEIDHKGPEFCINIIESTLKHQQGEALDGTPMRGKPLILQPWQKFVTYNIVGFVIKGTGIVRFHEALIYIPRKNSKAVSLDTDIPTPNGWKKMEDIHSGDYVFGQDGKPSRVISESEVFEKPMYLVRFEDGSEVKASADHIWTVQTKDSRRTSKREVKQIAKAKMELRETNGWYDCTTEDMVSDFVHKRKDGKGCEYKYRVPMNMPVEYPEKELPIDPYTFGVWLGDGGSKTTIITVSESDAEETTRNIEKYGHTVDYISHKDRSPGLYIDKAKERGLPNSFRNGLRELGVFKNKHIPDVYLQSSVSQRLELLQGLMDTDGTCSKAGQCVFCQKDEKIVEQFVELASSLGIKTTKRKNFVPCGDKICEAYTVSFFTDKTFPCFKMKRKADRLKDKLSERMRAKSIVSIEPIDVCKSKCIAIDNDTHLYLVGKRFTATHNTTFAAALAWALCLWYRKSGSKCYIASGALIQSLESYNFLEYNINLMGENAKHGGTVKVINNNNEHSLESNLPDGGSFYVRALASNPDAQDSLNSNISICDEIHTFKSPKQYNLFKECQKAYSNKIIIGISTAGDNEQLFLGQRCKYCRKVLDGTVKDEQYFIFMCCANPDENGDIDYTNPIVHEMANPSYGVTIRPEDILNDSLQAMNDPQQRKDFFAKSLNVYTNSLKAYFNMEEFQRSDAQYDWDLDALAKLPIKWYGGADLSKLHDLTAACLVGNYNGVDIVITHAWFPVVAAHIKADQDNIPLFEWLDNGWLTMSNNPTVNHQEVVNWFSTMRDRGFKIAQIGYDRKFCREFYIGMKQAKFRIVDTPQLYMKKSEGFRYIEKSAKNGTLYYLHSTAYEYCTSNVHAVEKVDDAIMYEKVHPSNRIDLFDSSVFAFMSYLECLEKGKVAEDWFK